MTPPTPPRAPSPDSLGLGFDVAVIVVLFGLAGYGLDRLLGTVPLLTIVFVVIGALGLFATFKHRYDVRMAEHEAARHARRTAPGGGQRTAPGGASTASRSATDPATGPTTGSSGGSAAELATDPAVTGPATTGPTTSAGDRETPSA